MAVLPASAAVAAPPPAVPTPAAERARARYVAEVVPVGPTLRGSASWYGPGFDGRPTASGERYDSTQLTAAHKTLPLGTRLRVCRTGRCVVVRVNDRGPYVGKRFLDLSHRAASRVGLTGPGIAHVTATVVKVRKRRAPAAVPPPVRRTPVRAAAEATRTPAAAPVAPSGGPPTATIAARPVSAAAEAPTRPALGDAVPGALALLLGACALTVSRRARRSAAR
jgi:rare lipoprotein A